ncbi:hypothetical protein QUA13_31425, partial [Microcoleus sp. S28C3]
AFTNKVCGLQPLYSLSRRPLCHPPSEDIQHQLEEIVSRYKSLGVDDLSAYVLMNGKCNSIVCPDTGLIDARVIDSVSDELAIEFDQLLNLV